jgi:hypothetical protein
MLARSSIKVTLLPVLVFVSLAGLVACEGGSKEFNLEILRGALTLSPSVLRVEQHVEVLLNMDTDQVGTIRIEDFDIEVQLDPTKMVPIRFTATKIGRFKVTWQAEGVKSPVDIASMDVRPAAW